LATLPAGTTVSVWAFGQKMPDAKTAEDTIKELLPPTPLPVAKGALLDPVLARIRGLEPWDKSPVVRSAIEAKHGLARAPGPFKAVVLISDAVDTRFTDDPGFIKAKRPLKDVLR